MQLGGRRPQVNGALKVSGGIGGSHEEETKYFRKLRRLRLVQKLYIIVHFFLRADQTNLGPEEHTSELQSPCNLVCRLLLEKKNYIRGKYLTYTRPCHRPHHQTFNDLHQS